jgi:hypothetical protein
MKALVQTADGVVLVDVQTEEVLDLGPGAGVETPAAPAVSLPRVLAAVAVGSTVVVLVDTRPPLMVSHDTGRTWRESGRGLPPGRAIAVAEEDPDRMLFATENRLYVSTDGGRFWQGLTVELPEIEAVAWAE